MRRFGGLLAEALRMARAQPVTTVVTGVIVAAVCGVIVSTTGQTVAIERDVLGRIDDAGTRSIVVEDTEGRARLDPRSVTRVLALTGVDWAIGFGLVNDVRPVGLDSGPAVPIRAYVGELPPPVTTSAWTREPGTAVAGLDAIATLGLRTAAGPVQPVADNEPQLGVVGWLRAGAPLEFLNRGLLRAAAEDEAVIRIIAQAEAVQQVPRLADAIRSVLDPADPSSLAVRTSDALVQVRAAVQGELGTFGRNLVTLVLGAGLVLTALNVFGAVMTQRRDFGRRRALGASRADIMVLVTAQTVATAVVGALAGALAGSLVVRQTLGIAADAEFSAATVIMAVIATALAALPPAVVAAYRDPVRILRVA